METPFAPLPESIKQDLENHLKWLANPNEGTQLHWFQKDVRGLDFRKSCFRNAVLIGADFSESNLKRACFESAHLYDCMFYDSILRQVSFKKADIHGCVFRRANTYNARFDDAKLVKTFF